MKIIKIIVMKCSNAVDTIYKTNKYIQDIFIFYVINKFIDT